MTGRRYSEREIEQAKESVNLSELVGRFVKLTHKGAEHTGLCPFHNEKTGSFTVNDSKGFFHCFGCGAHGNAITFLMRRQNLTFPQAIEELLGGVISDPIEQEKLQKERTERKAAQVAKTQYNLGVAWRCWDKARVAVPGDPVWRYLHGRSCLVSPVPEILRFEPRMWHPDFMSEAGPVRTWPAMITRVDDVRGKFCGMHMTYLVEVDGRYVQDPELKAQRKSKRTKGPIHGGAIRLFAAGADVAGGRIAVDEGIENALSIYQMRGDGVPVWAMSSHTHLGGFEIPAWCTALDIHSQRDTPQPGGNGKEYAPEGVGMKSARKLQLRSQERGLSTRVLLPVDGHKDSNDAWLARLSARGRLTAGSVEAAVL